MCGRFTLIVDGDRITVLTGWIIRLPVHPRYNIAPTQNVLVARRASEAVEVVEMRWGLIPERTRERAARPMINARAESVLEKPTFRGLLERRRCLVPADGFYEWQATGARTRQPWWFHPRDGGVLTFAGLWDRWVSAAGQVIESCTIVTTSANATLEGIHERMPVIIAPGDRDAWLDVERVPPHAAAALLQPAPDTLLEAIPVSAAVNRVMNDGPGLVAPTGLPDAPRPSNFLASQQLEWWPSG